MATELSSGAISSILEAVPGIATVLRSPVADAIVNLSRAAADLIPFDPKDAHELIRYAVRRGLIRSDEGDRVAAEIDGVAPPRPAVKPPAPKPVVVAAPPPPAAAPRRPFKAAPRPSPVKARKKAAPRPKAKPAAKKKNNKKKK